MQDPDAQEFQFMIPGKSFEKLLQPDMAQVTQHNPHAAFRKLVGGALSPAALGRLLPELQVRFFKVLLVDAAIPLRCLAAAKVLARQLRVTANGHQTGREAAC